MVIYCYDLFLNGLTGGIPHLTEEISVDSPRKVHGILGEDDVLILEVVSNPLVSNLDFGTGDIEDHAFVISFVERDDLASTDKFRKVGRHQVFLEEAGRIDELEGDGFGMAVVNVIRITVFIQIKMYIVRETGGPYHLQKLVDVYNFGEKLEANAGEGDVEVVGV